MPQPPQYGVPQPPQYEARPQAYGTPQQTVVSQPPQYGANQPVMYGGMGGFDESPYYLNPSKKKISDGKIAAIALTAVFLSVFLIVAIGAIAMKIKDDRARADAYETELYLEDTYGITIFTGTDADISESGFSIDYMENDSSISTALDNLQVIFDRLPEGFLDDVMEGYGAGRHLEINITGAMTQDESDRSIVGLTTYEQNKDVIRLDSTVTAMNGFQATVAHELFHVIDFEMNQFDEHTRYTTQWEQYNPRGFEYSGEEGEYSDYTVYGEGMGSVYFVSLYSKEDIFEDRAEVFSFLLATEENSKLPKAYGSSFVKNKAKILVTEIADSFGQRYSSAYWSQWVD